MVKSLKASTLFMGLKIIRPASNMPSQCKTTCGKVLVLKAVQTYLGSLPVIIRGRYLCMRQQILRGLYIGVGLAQRPGDGQPIQHLQLYHSIAHGARGLPPLPAPAMHTNSLSANHYFKKVRV